MTGPQNSAGDAAGDVLVRIERIRGSEFADRLVGDAKGNVFAGGAGNDVLTGGLGPDIFQWLGTGDGLDTITDFQKGVGGDILDVIDMIRPGAETDTTANFLRFIQSHGNTYLQVDADGSKSGFNFTTVALLQGVSGSDVTIEKFIANGNLRY